jgi:hypothetical protein
MVRGSLSGFLAVLAALIAILAGSRNHPRGDAAEALEVGV